MENTLCKSKKTKLLFFLTFIIIYITDSLLFGTNSNKIFIYINRFGIVFIALFYCFYKLVIKSEKINPGMLFLTICIFSSMILAGGFSKGYFYFTMIACSWFGYLFAKDFSLEQFSHYFCIIMRAIAIVSLIVWFFSDFFSNLNFLPVITNSVGVEYRTLFFTNIPLLSHLAERNMGPFWEPGTYQIYLNIALYFSLFIENHRLKVFDCILFVVSCLTTLSGASLVPIILLILAYLIEKKHIKSFVLVIILVLLIILLLNTGMFDVIFKKMNNEYGTNSIVYRWIGIEGSVKGFLKGPIFGSTPATNEAIKGELALKYLRQSYSSNTNTFLNYFAYFGIFVGVLMSYGSIQCIKSTVNSWFSAILIFSAYFISTSNENMMTSLLVVVLAFLRSEKSRLKGT